MDKGPKMDTCGTPDFTRCRGEGFQIYEQKMSADKLDMEPNDISRAYGEINEQKIFCR
jgi:hypothetical protein